MPMASMFEMTQLSMRRRLAACRTMPCMPPCPLIDRPRSTTVPPGALTVTPLPEVTLMPA